MGRRTLERPKRRCEGSLENRVERCELDSSGSRAGPVTGSCEHGNDPSGNLTSWATISLERRSLLQAVGDVEGICRITLSLSADGY
jgi:hypothetical protein